MNIQWVLSEKVELDPLLNIQKLKDVGPIWGSWKTWRSCATDNVICSDLARARELLARQFQNTCNFFVPATGFADLDRPTGVKLYDGQFGMETDCPDDIVAMHLAATQCDIVLLLGFDWRPKPADADRLTEHRSQNYRNLVKHCLLANNQIQWVLIDHMPDLMPEVKDLGNLTVDTMNSALNLVQA